MPRLEDRCWYGDEPDGAGYRALKPLDWADEHYEPGDMIPPRPMSGHYYLSANGKLRRRIGPGGESTRELAHPPDRESLVEQGLAERL